MNRQSRIIRLNYRFGYLKTVDDVQVNNCREGWPLTAGAGKIEKVAIILSG
jgi:hypothetical protein